MKKLIYTFGVVALFAGLAACSGKKQQEEIKADDAKIAELESSYQQASSFNDSLIMLMGDIYTGLDSINSQEQLLYAPGQGDNANRRQEIKQNLGAIKARLAANREILDQLEKKLKTSNTKNEVLARTIAQLKARIDAQDKRVQELETQLADARNTINEQNQTIARQGEQIKTETAAKEQAQTEATEANNELNVVYYAIGTNKELKANDIISKKFLGATKVLQGNFNQQYFTKGDKRNISVIPTGGKKLKVWSNNPKDSYSIVKDANGNGSLQITDPVKFWSRSPYLIIQIDK